METKKVRILLYDLEVTPMLAWVYGMYQTNVIEVEQYPYILCFSYRWLDEKKIHSHSLVDYPARYKKDDTDDYDVVKELHSLLDEADIVVAHNANGFDNKVANARFLAHNLSPPSPYKTVDTLSVARSRAKFSSNKLDLLGQQLHLGRKTKETHGSLWRACIDGDSKAWAKMVKYCEQDVKLLVSLYERLLPYINNHPNIAVISGREDACPRCGGRRIHSRGTRSTNAKTYRRFQCYDCGAWLSERTSDKEEFTSSTYVNYS